MPILKDDSANRSEEKRELLSHVADNGKLKYAKDFVNALGKVTPGLEAISSIVSFSKSVADLIFLKKIIAFLFELEGVSESKIERELKRIDTSSKYGARVGETLLMIIGECKSYEIAGMIGSLFRAYLNGIIKFDEFREMQEAIIELGAKRVEWYCIEAPERILAKEAEGTAFSSLWRIDSIDTVTLAEDEWSDTFEQRLYGITGLGRGEMYLRKSDLGKRLMDLLEF